jgi:2-hydroxychromene-2-carboxylate isomerase
LVGSLFVDELPTRGNTPFPMPQHLDFWFDYSCPFAYLGSTQVAALAKRMGATLAYKPMLLGGIFQARGTPQRLFEAHVPPKAHHNALDMQRWAEFYGVPLTMPSGHPLRTVEALRATLVTGSDPKVIAGFYRAYWVEGRGPSEPDTLRDVLRAAGHDPESILLRIAEPSVKDELRARTEEAVALGIFGAPSYVVDGKLFWGQDRAHFVAGLRIEELWPARTKPGSTSASSPHTLEVYWDFSSPFAYLGLTQAEALAERTGAKLVYRPMLLGGLFKQVGQPMVPMQTWSPARQAYLFDDLNRWATYWGVPFKFPSNFPLNSLKALRCYLALPLDRQRAFRDATFRAAWGLDRNIADDAVLRELLGDAADETLARSQSSEVKQALVSATERAAAAGVFGAPAWVVDEKDLYWGQDRTMLVERALLT